MRAISHCLTALRVAVMAWTILHQLPYTCCKLQATKQHTHFCLQEGYEILFCMFQQKFCAILQSKLLIDNVQILFLKYHKLFWPAFQKRQCRYLTFHKMAFHYPSKKEEWDGPQLAPHIFLAFSVHVLFIKINLPLPKFLPLNSCTKEEAFCLKLCTH